MADAAPVWARASPPRTAWSSPTSTGSPRGGTPTPTSAATIEVVTDMSKSRLAGFTTHHRTLDSFLALFDRYADERLVPRAG